VPKIIEFYLCIQMLPAKCKCNGFTLAGPPCTSWQSHFARSCSQKKQQNN